MKTSIRRCGVAVRTIKRKGFAICVEAGLGLDSRIVLIGESTLENCSSIPFQSKKKKNIKTKTGSM
jgi:hypothetical protein